MTEHYELLYLVPMSYSADEVKPIINKVENLIKDNEGKITASKDLGKVKLSYPIKTISHGYYFLAEFDLPSANLLNINRGLKLTNEVLRFLITKKEIKSAQQIKVAAEIQEKIAKKKADTKAAEEKVSKEKIEKDKGKISLEELDKKLDEILEGTDEIM